MKKRDDSRINIFSIDFTESEQNTVLDGEALVSRRVSPETNQRARSLRDHFEMMEKQAELPLVLRVIRVGCLLGFFVILLFIVQGHSSFTEGFEKTPLLYWGLLITVAVWLLLGFLGGRKAAAVRKSGSPAELEKEIAEVDAVIRSELGIPDDAAEIDVLCGDYVVKDGKKRRFNRMYDLLNRSRFLFREGENLCLADMEKVVSFPADAIGAVTKINKKTAVPSWHKASPPTSETYRPYQIQEITGVLNLSAYYRMEVGDEYELLIPNYDFKNMLDAAELKMRARVPEKDEPDHE